MGERCEPLSSRRLASRPTGWASRAQTHRRAAPGVCSGRTSRGRRRKGQHDARCWARSVLNGEVLSRGWRRAHRARTTATACRDRQLYPPSTTIPKVGSTAAAASRRRQPTPWTRTTTPRRDVTPEIRRHRHRGHPRVLAADDEHDDDGPGDHDHGPRDHDHGADDAADRTDDAADRADDAADRADDAADRAEHADHAEPGHDHDPGVEQRRWVEQRRRIEQLRRRSAAEHRSELMPCRSRSAGLAALAGGSALLLVARRRGSVLKLTPRPPRLCPDRRGRTCDHDPGCVRARRYRSSMSANPCTLASWWWASIRRTVPLRLRMTKALGRHATGVEGHAVQERSVGDAGRGEEAVVAVNEVLDGQHGGRVEPGVGTIATRSASSCGHSRPWISPPMHLSAAAEMTPSGVPPTPISTSTPNPPTRSRSRRDVAVLISWIRAPAGADSSIRSAWRGRSRITTVRSSTNSRRLGDPAQVLRRRRGDVDRADGLGPTAIFSM